MLDVCRSLDTVVSPRNPCERARPGAGKQRIHRESESDMVNRSRLLGLALPLLICLSGSASAQGYHQFLGSPRTVPDQFSPRFGIRYNTQGYDEPQVNWTKKIKKWQKKGVPDWAIDQIISYPGSDDAIGKWIDDSFAKTRAEFARCGGSLADRANRVSPNGLSVLIMPTAFYEPYWKINVAGVYYPSMRQIRVLNIYYMWRGPNKGWLRHARDLIQWEVENFFAVETKVQPEPRPAGWPCTAPSTK